MAAAVFSIQNHFLTRAKQNRAAESAESFTVRLPFTIPCAVTSSDAGPVYAALRKRDRNGLKELFANKKFVAVKRGLEVRIANFGAVSMIVVEARPPDQLGVCFVPASVVPAIRQHASP